MLARFRPLAALVGRPISRNAPSRTGKKIWNAAPSLAVGSGYWKAPSLYRFAAVAASTGTACAFCSASAPPTSSSRTEWTPPNVILYQYEPCPYCCKVKAVLDYLQIPYDVVEVNPLTKKETQAFTDYKKVPVCKINGEIVVDSSAIISRVRELVPDDRIGSTDGVSSSDEEKWRQWVDQKLIVMLPPNIYRTVPETLQAFEYCLTEGKFTALERRVSKYAGAGVMYLIAKKAKKKYEIINEREALYEALNAWADAVGERNFLGGNVPNLADLSVFGVVRSVVGLQTFDDVMANTSIGPWFQRMTVAVGSTTRLPSKQL